jgi:hypothetical protein
MYIGRPAFNKAFVDYACTTCRKKVDKAVRETIIKQRKSHGR